MSKPIVLFLTTHYNKASAANSIIAKNMAEEFVKEGAVVYVIARGEVLEDSVQELNGLTIHIIKETFLERLLQKSRKNEGGYNRIVSFLILFAHRICAFFYYPYYNPSDIHCLYKKACSLILKKKITHVVATTNNYENVVVAMKLKSKWSELKVITYHLDLLEGVAGDKSAPLSSFRKWRAKRAIQRELAVVNRLLLPENAKRNNNPKVQLVGFPVYLTDNSRIIAPFNYSQDGINIVYIGSLDSQNRNPSYILELLGRLDLIGNKKVILHIYGRLADETTKKIVLNAESERCRYYGVVQPDEANSFCYGADFLLVIGNKGTEGMLPSKVFQYFAAHKPIIACIRNPKDNTIPYLEQYNSHVSIMEYNHDLEKNIVEVRNFISANYRKELFFDDSAFVRFTPAYICKLILNEE